MRRRCHASLCFETFQRNSLYFKRSCLNKARMGKKYFYIVLLSHQFFYTSYFYGQKLSIIKMSLCCRLLTLGPIKCLALVSRISLILSPGLLNNVQAWFHCYLKVIIPMFGMELLLLLVYRALVLDSRYLSGIYQYTE